MIGVKPEEQGKGIGKALSKETQVGHLPVYCMFYQK
ncbi:hypothetical protein [Paenibacillus harenae]|nr:hypothetical protein [Paenibacillus harenae]